MRSFLLYKSKVLEAVTVYERTKLLRSIEEITCLDKGKLKVLKLHVMVL